MVFIRDRKKIEFGFEALNTEPWIIRVIRNGKEASFALPAGKNLDDLDVGVRKWISGEFIQDALGWLNADQREFIMTGMTPEEWDETFPALHLNPDDGKWYFWIETWADREGPYETEEEARRKLVEYAKTL